ncbi:Putative Holin-X, holin superfamily III [Streptomyces sp. 2231.1]|uniref:phage holin family protein n=1 Tax=Streptomyces sp. 2231.1 TaxID=1855347 RepID=UPI0008977F31|nr:phage holin family protein [Streptomyces sp. 2231.1]SEC75041.1 Putative Holin-X, holin superfamily III [Streptomyces sp. 2231.1]
MTQYARPAAHGRPSTGEPVGRATEQLSRPLRQAVALAKEEPAEKGRRAGRGGGLLGAAGAAGYVGLIVLAGAATAALVLALPGWVAAPTVAAVFFAVTAVPAATGRARLRRAAPPAPEETPDSVRADVDVIRERAHR